LRYHASRGNPSGGEEVRDGPHNHNRGGGSCGGVAPATVPLLMPQAGALRGPGPSLCQGSSAVGCVTPRLLDRSIQVKLRSGPLPPYGPSRVFSLVAPSFSHRIRRGLRLATAPRPKSSRMFTWQVLPPHHACYGDAVVQPGGADHPAPSWKEDRRSVDKRS
jgi:hypothetical protein